MSVTEATLEKKFLSVSNTQDSIQTLSLWLLHHKAHHKKIVDTWLKVIKKDKVSHKLTLFYLANDVIQNCKRKNVSFFKDSFAEVLKDATVFMRDEHIKSSVERVFRIWGERNVYESNFISELQSILAESENSSDAEEARIVAEFKVTTVVTKIKQVTDIGYDISSKTATINFSKLDATNAEIIQKFKDRRHGQQFTRDFDESARCLDNVVKLIDKEIDERNELIVALEESHLYYESQRTEAKIVANAYKNFAQRVKMIQKKLTEILEMFRSPVLSPEVDVPSPTNSDTELKLPGEQNDEKSDVDQNQEPVSSFAESISKTTVGNPIPTVSNIFNQEPGAMTSWLDTFAKKETPVVTTSTQSSNQNSVSLDSRLSSLLQNIPNLTSGLPSTLFSSSMPLNMPESIMNSPATGDKTLRNNIFQPSEVETSTKEDEHSGQNTPLQDEDTPSSPSTFFTRLAAAPKTSQSPKEILKGLKSFIQNASNMSNEKSLTRHDNSLSWSSNKAETEKKESSLSNKILPHYSDTSRNLPSTTSYEAPQQHSAISSVISKHTTPLLTSSSQVSFSSTHSYSTKTHSPETSLSQNIHKNLSFIPTLVPSTPTTTNFDFPPEDTYCPYSPTHENFETDMDIESNCDENSPEQSIGTPDISDDKIDNDDLMLPRQSTLITLVTDNNTNVEGTNETTTSLPESVKNFSNVKDSHLNSQSSYSTSEVVPFLEPTISTVESHRMSFSSSISLSETEGYPTSVSNAYSTSVSSVYPTSVSSAYPTSVSSVYPTSVSSAYPTSVSSVYSQNVWPITVQPQGSTLLSPLDNVPKSTIPPVNCEDENSLGEDYFLTSPPPSVENEFPNGQSKSDTDLRIMPPFSNVTPNPPFSNITSNPPFSNVTSNPPFSNITSNPPFSNVTSNTPLSKIETIDSHRTITEDDSWNTDDMWNNFEHSEDKNYERKQFRGHHGRGEQHNRHFDGPRQRFPYRDHRQHPYAPRFPMNFQRGTQQRRFRLPPPPPPQFLQRDGNWNRFPRPRF